MSFLRDASINLKMNWQPLSQVRATPQGSPQGLALGLGEGRVAEKARTDERSHGWRSEEAEQQERSRMRSDERLRGITSLAEAECK